MNFFAISGCDMHFKTELRREDQNNLHMKFSALDVDFNNPSSDPLGSRRPAHAGVKDWYPPKRGYLSAVGLSSVKMVADRHRHAA